MGLFVAPDESGSAKGLLFWDDGTSYETQEHTTYFQLELTYQKAKGKSVLYSNITNNNFPEAANVLFGYITFCNQPLTTKVLFNSQNLNMNRVKYNAQTKVLHLEKLSFAISERFEIVLIQS
ncbi:hypothetical protein JTE90_004728 [Oedothorax gibbosus]|nr:hypothetical protein JTE90_004728 [Oedothorax gibbosus]